MRYKAHSSPVPFEVEHALALMSGVWAITVDSALLNITLLFPRQSSLAVQRGVEFPSRQVGSILLHRD